jgi:hypothetical protein
MKRMVAGALAVLSSAAPAEVVSSRDNGFQVRHDVELSVPPAAAFAAFGRIGDWWDKEHTYSGDARNMTLALTPGGCFCERLPKGGGIEHMRVAFVDPGKRIVMTGSLGPLLYDATAGVMDVTFEETKGGTKVILIYKVAGFANGGADKVAPIVDKVLGLQIGRFKSDKTPGRSYQ